MLCGCIFCGRLETSRIQRRWECNVTNRDGHHVCKLPHILAQLVTNINRPKYCRSRVHCIIMCFTRGFTADDDGGWNEQIIYSPHKKSQVRMSSSWRQVVLYKNSYRDKRFPANQTHCIKIPPLQIQRKILTNGNNIHTNWWATGWYSYQATFEWSVLYPSIHALRLGLHFKTKLNANRKELVLCATLSNNHSWPQYKWNQLMTLKDAYN